MPAPLIAVIGSSNTDLVITTPRLPLPGETLLGGEFQRHAGGKGANQAVAAVRAGARVLFIGARGDDDFGTAAHAGLEAEGIDVSAFTVKPGHSSGVALILLGGKERQNQIVVARSANDALAPADIDAAADKLVRASVIVCQLETPLEAVCHAAEFAGAHGIPFLLNPAPAPASQSALPATLLARVHTLTPNEHEAALLTGEPNPERAAAALLQRGCKHVVITLGAEGALIASRAGEDEEATNADAIPKDANVSPEGANPQPRNESGITLARLPAPSVTPVDTVGAGDCFTGWLAVGIAENLPLPQAAARAIRAASLQVTRPGAQAAMPRRGEL